MLRQANKYYLDWVDLNLPFLLKILIGPSKPVIKISDKSTSVLAQDLTPLTLIAGDNVTALTNTSITIQCPTSGIPKPTVSWTKDGQEILIGGRYRVKDDGSLLISEADEVDNARYTCTAGSVSGKDSASSTMQVVGKNITYSCMRHFAMFLILRFNVFFPRGLHGRISQLESSVLFVSLTRLVVARVH